MSISWYFLVLLAYFSVFYMRGEANTVDTSVVGSTESRKRRERYSGKFPRKYSLKYKELSNNGTIIERGSNLRA